MADSPPRVFTLPPSVDFLRTLVGALLDGRIVPGFAPRSDPEALAGATLYLPTRRACRLAADVFLDVLGQEAALLPRLAPIGDIDEDELIFAEAGAPLAVELRALAPAIEPLERRMLLAQLILQWTRSRDVGGGDHAPLVAGTPAAALALADDLARLIDDMTTREAPWSRLDGFVPDHLDCYWQLTLKFLTLAREAWPAILAERGAIEAAERRDRLIAAESERLRTRHAGPVIAAGSTASMPATAKLLGAIARLPHGAVVLPGLDTHLDEASWRLIGGEGTDDEGRKVAPAVVHPQYAMQGFLAQLGLRRDEVVALAPSVRAPRERLLSEVLRPAQATDLWAAGDRAASGEGLAGVAVIEAATAEEEALAIAVALREALETPDHVAALVTPDRALARRTMAALTRWNVAFDDSGGDPLAESPAGVFARLCAQAALRGLEPVTLAALLKHPRLRLGAPEDGHAAAISALERAVLHGPRPQPQTRGLVDALATFQATRASLHPRDPRAGVREPDIRAAGALARRLAAALQPLESAGAAPRTLSAWAAAHCEAMERLSAEADGALAFADRDGELLRELFDSLAELGPAADLALAAGDYVDLLEALMAGRVVRRPPNPQARVRIFGLLEARLQHPDRIVLGGLTEGVWPPQTRSDPWLSRPMRQALGLDLPERRIGLTAHDFTQAMGCADVILSRAAKLGGAPTVPSRFLQRLAAVAGKERWDAACAAGARYVRWARGLDRPAAVAPIAAPEPRPPLAARPARLSVTEIEHWLRDPYTIYAKYILALTPLEPLDAPPDGRDRGGAIHQAIEDFTRHSLHALPADPLAVLMELGEKAFVPLKDFPEAQAFWWPRFRRIARWFVGWERARRPGIRELFAEVRGEAEIPMGAGVFTLACRADRFEQCGDGSFSLVDYKTGQVATAAQVRSGFAPQLTLEAAIAQRGGFRGIPKGARIAALSYVQLRGGEPAGKECPITWKDSSPEAEAARAFERVTRLVQRFADEAMPYRSLVHPMWSRRYGDYDHLARVKEWAASEGDDEGYPG